MSNHPHKTSHAANTRRPRPRPRISWTWLGILIPIAAVVALVVVGTRTDGTTTITAKPGTQATMFELPTTAGTTVSLQDTLARGDALLYFSMGVGCDGCFAQIPEVEVSLAAEGISLVPVMVQPVDVVRSTAESWGIDLPILIDADLSVSKSYDMIGINGHSDRPFHSIVLVREDGTVAFSKTYDTMFVGLDEMMADIVSLG